MSISRRSFLRRTGLVALAFSGLRNHVQSPAWAQKKKDFSIYGFGPLKDDPDKIFDLPAGFSYRLISEAGEKMDDGLRVPGLHDGMCAFPGSGGKTILVRNHEIDQGQTQHSPFGPKNVLLQRIAREKFYDAGKGGKPCLGGTTTLIYDTANQRLEKHFLSLTGTIRNCAGGPTPWRSWITCEETVATAGDALEEDHGYNFEVPATEEIQLAAPIALKDMGRFNHEAVAVDPKTSIVYQTEDRHEGLLYRFIPNRAQDLRSGGKLQALKIKDLPSADTRNWKRQTLGVGEKVAVEWVDIENPEAPDDDLRYQGFFDKDAARFARGEGIWYDKNTIYVACTNGGKAKKGQIWKYRLSPHEGSSRENEQPGHLELFIEPNDGNLVENCDNLTMAPWGDLIICEDGNNPQYLVGVTPEGKLYQLGRTTLSELAGATFSPDGSTLFVNIQVTGMTIAITGPWQDLRVDPV